MPTSGDKAGKAKLGSTRTASWLPVVPFNTVDLGITRQGGKKPQSGSVLEVSDYFERKPRNI